MGVGGEPAVRPAVFLDRDGTLNRCFPGDGTTHPPAGLADLALVDDAAEACERLRDAGYLLLVVTNQPDVRRGLQTRARVEEINAHLLAALGLDGCAVCYHDDRDGCACRKPLPGLLLDLARRHDVDLGRSWMVGDRPADVEAGLAAGCRTVLVSEVEQDHGQHHRTTSLIAAADAIVNASTFRETRMPTELSALTVKIFADGADLPDMAKMYRDPLIKGFTTNPTLMRKAGVRNYELFAREVLEIVPDRPVSFEVLSDGPDAMFEEALVIGAWADNVYVKIPITNSEGRSTIGVVRQLHQAGIKVNVTAVLTLEQVRAAAVCFNTSTPSIVSVFAGRIADTGRDPLPLMAEAASILHARPGVELLWASPRELLNVFHAEEAGCDIITATTDVLAKRHLVGKDLDEYSLETVRMFCEDSRGLDVTLGGQPAGLVPVSG